MTVWCDRSLHYCSHYIGLCTTEPMFHNELKKMKMPMTQWPKFLKNEWASATAHEFESGNKLSVIVCMPVPKAKGVTGIQIAALLVHEAVHIWQWHCKQIGEDSPSKEYEAYGIQNIAQELMGAYAAQTKGRK